jgi:hypothetical protein
MNDDSELLLILCFFCNEKTFFIKVEKGLSFKYCSTCKQESIYISLESFCSNPSFREDFVFSNMLLV